MLAAAKLDLVHEATRLKKRVDERDDTVRKQQRVIDAKDQTIAELGPVFKATSRANAAANAEARRRAEQRGWSY